MRVLINGRPQELTPGTTLGAAVAELHGAPEGRGVAAALDGEVIPQRDWPTTELADGSVVELVVAVQGG